jgi:hypothetical protein
VSTPTITRRRSGRALRVAVAGVVVLVVAGVAGWYFLVRDTAKPVTVDRAVKSFRHRSGGALAGTVNGAAVPAAGVYAYRTTGSESFDLGVVNSRHAYPSRTVITVRRGGCGVQMRWEPLDVRSTTWETCPARGFWTVASFDEVHEFFGQRNDRDYRCAGGPVAWSSERPRLSLASTCRSPQTTSVARGRSLGVETVDVGGRSVKAVHVRLRVRLSGESDGVGTSDTWYALRSGLVVRRAVTNDNRTDTSAGTADYRERYELRLESLDPKGAQ